MESSADAQPDKPSGRRIGIFGGTFDPIHIGHLVIAEEARVSLRLSAVRFVPAADPPHKPRRPLSPAETRFAIASRATQSHPDFAVSRSDIDRPGPHYTVELLELIRDEVGPDVELHFIMGADSLQDLLSWRDPVRIVEMARLAVAQRPGYEPDLPALERELPGLTSRVDFLETPRIGISATDIRRRIASGRPIRFQVPDAVESYIRQLGLYVDGKEARK